MATRSRMPSVISALGSLTVLLVVLITAPLSGQSTNPPSDGLWTPAGDVTLPPDYAAPTEYFATLLDLEQLDLLLADAPREQPGRVLRDVVISLPLPDGDFVQVGVASTRLMEPGLSAAFPSIRTYAFESLGDRHVAGHMIVGAEGVRAAAQLAEGLFRIDPVMAREGTVHLSYLDALRGDGTNVIEHSPDEHEGGEHEPPPPGLLPLLAPEELQLNAVESGGELRIYRLAASTTGEFYQARDGGGGDVDVLASIIADLVGANAVFEPEVAVRLILADVSLELLYNDPATDPFNNAPQCENSGDACASSADCDEDEACKAEQSPCELREANRDDLKANVADDEYDLGFLFAARPGGGASGCAWYVVCLTTDDTLHKGRGAGQMGNNGTNSASGLLAHEVGHQLGARHTFSGLAGACTEAEFLAGDSESGYEPGSGTTRMSYRGNCADDPDEVDDPQDDNVDTSLVPAGSYFHSRSFDEIVTNAFTGDGSTCGTVVATGNLPPTVDAGLDYTIPRQTPFMLTGTAFDDEPLTFSWEQYDRAEYRRPIDTDPGDGPIIRSVPPGTDPTRTVPNLQDLLAGVSRKGEILPQVDRDLNFRFVARDNRMGGGGVAYDDMVIHVAGPPFFITSPNSGTFESGCPLPITWEVGGGDVAPSVSVLYSSDGGLNFNTTLAAATANDGAYQGVVPCATNADGRLKVQAVDNIFFDINDADLTTFNTPPTVNVTTAGGSVDDACEFLVEFEATATDTCGLEADNVNVALFKAEENFSLGTPTINVLQVSTTEVSITGSVMVYDLLSSPAVLTVDVTAFDGCGLQTSDSADAVVIDDTPPSLEVALTPSTLWPPNHKMAVITANVAVADNCPGVQFVLDSVTSDEPDDGEGDGNTVNDIQGVEAGTSDLSFSVRQERSGNGDGRVYTATYSATDGSDNAVQDSATVTVPKSK